MEITSDSPQFANDPTAMTVHLHPMSQVTSALHTENLTFGTWIILIESEKCPQYVLNGLLPWALGAKTKRAREKQRDSRDRWIQSVRVWTAILNELADEKQWRQWQRCIIHTDKCFSSVIVRFRPHLTPTRSDRMIWAPRMSANTNVWSRRCGLVSTLGTIWSCSLFWQKNLWPENFHTAFSLFFFSFFPPFYSGKRLKKCWVGRDTDWTEINWDKWYSVEGHDSDLLRLRRLNISHTIPLFHTKEAETFFIHLIHIPTQAEKRLRHSKWICGKVEWGRGGGVAFFFEVYTHTHTRLLTRGGCCVRYRAASPFRHFTVRVIAWSQKVQVRSDSSDRVIFVLFV